MDFFFASIFSLLFFLSTSHQSLLTTSRHISYSSPDDLQSSGKTLAIAVECSIRCLQKPLCCSLLQPWAALVHSTLPAELGGGKAPHRCGHITQQQLLHSPDTA